MKIQLLKKLPYTVQTIHPKEILNNMPKAQPFYKKTYLIACSLLSLYCGAIYANAALNDASRFLNRATFGATSKDILLLSSENTRNQTITYQNWLQKEFAKPTTLIRPLFEKQATELNLSNIGNVDLFLNAWHTNTLTANDQLRQRVAFALSEIFVISMNDTRVAGNARIMADYYDNLLKGSFGNYRDLLEKVTLHPAMGLYLNTLGNKKASGTSVPDENYAREVMQLFTIGLYQLHLNGNLKLDANKKPIETYTNKDITELAKAFTGWGYACIDTSTNCYNGRITDPDRFIKPMQNYPQFYETGAKNFLGRIIPNNVPAEVNMRMALDALFLHPNVGPFISKQLIQRLVTSNPSPQYIARVARVFNNYKGERGNLKAVIEAILMDKEALNVNLNSTTAGKIKEPLLRLSQLLRATHATSQTGYWKIGYTDNISYAIGQTPLKSPSVFNFFRPNYVPPTSYTGKLNLLAPELQITDTASVVGYNNYMLNVIFAGIGSNVTNNGVTKRDVQPNFAIFTPIAKNSAILVEQLNTLLAGGRLNSNTKLKIASAVDSIVIPTLKTNTNGSNNQTSIDAALLNRSKLAISMVIAQPDYLVQM